MNARQMPKLPCPFCGSVDLSLETDVNNILDGDLKAVGCINCDAIGPMTKTLTAAVRKWNERKAS